MSTGWEAINERIDREFACEHAPLRLVVRITSNGRKQFLRQCQRCGKKTTSSLRYADLTPAEMAAAPPLDDELEKTWVNRRWERRTELYQEAVQEEKQAWWERYEAYLETPKWQLKSGRVCERDKLCQACLSRPAVQAHHKDYRHVGDEPLFDLVGVCLECHRKLHDPEAIALALRKNFEQAGMCV
jgi:hypothetical protein